jgi:hypothetical protein
MKISERIAVSRDKLLAAVFFFAIMVGTNKKASKWNGCNEDFFSFIKALG